MSTFLSGYHTENEIIQYIPRNMHTFCCALLCCGYAIVHNEFTWSIYHIHQGCFAGTGAIVRLPQCQWSKPDGYGEISQCITTTKHSKAKTVCIFLRIYCNSTEEVARIWAQNWLGLNCWFCVIVTVWSSFTNATLFRRLSKFQKQVHILACVCKSDYSTVVQISLKWVALCNAAPRGFPIV